MTFSEFHNRWGKKMVLWTPLISAFGEMRTLLTSIDIDIEMTDGWRGEEEQNKILAAGNSKAKFGNSPHNYAMAFDCCPVVEGQLSYGAPEDVWYKIGMAGEKYGLCWGNDWDGDGIINQKDPNPGSSFVDRPHFQRKDFKYVKPMLTLYRTAPPVG